MKLKLNSLAAAVLVALAAGGAQAQLANTTDNLGNSSLIFVAIDSNNNTSFIANLGLSMSDFLPGATRTQGGSNINWAFNGGTAGTSTDSAVSGIDYKTNFTTFATTQSGGDLKWAVFSGDDFSGPVDSTNSINGKGWLITGNPTAAVMAGVTTVAGTTNGLGNLGNFIATAANKGSLTSATSGSAAVTSTDGLAWIEGTSSIKGRFGTSNTAWTYYSNNNIASRFTQQIAVTSNPDVFQIGDPTGALNSLAANPGTFNFDVASGNLTWQVSPVPEPSSLAMLIAGLVSVGTIARRRKS